MKKIRRMFYRIIFSLLVGLSSMLNAQNYTIKDSVSVKPKSRYIFERGGNFYKMNEFQKVFVNEEARNYINKARKTKTLGDAIMISGVIISGYGLSEILTPKISKNSDGIDVTSKKGYYIFAGGAAVLVAGIPFVLKTRKLVYQAIDKENDAMKNYSTYYQFNLQGNGISFTYHF